MHDRLLISFLLHKLGSSEYTGDVYSLPPDWLERIMTLAATHACGFTRLDQVQTIPTEQQQRVVAITFDDGFESDVTQALPLLQQHGAVATFFITPGFIGQTGYLNWEQVRQLASAGMAVGSHSLTHACLSTLTEDQLREELVGSRHRLEDALGVPVTLLSLPGGFYNRRVLAAAWEAGYTLVGTSDWGVDPLTNPHNHERRVVRRNGIDLRTSWDTIDSLLQGHVPQRILLKEQSKRLMSRLMPAWYQWLSNAWRRRFFIYQS